MEWPCSTVVEVTDEGGLAGGVNARDRDERDGAPAASGPPPPSQDAAATAVRLVATRLSIGSPPRDGAEHIRTVGDRVVESGTDYGPAAGHQFLTGNAL